VCITTSHKTSISLQVVKPFASLQLASPVTKPTTVNYLIPISVTNFIHCSYRNNAPVRILGTNEYKLRLCRFVLFHFICG